MLLLFLEVWDKPNRVSEASVNECPFSTSKLLIDSVSSSLASQGPQTMGERSILIGNKEI
jgi:hypothetical protein